MPHGDGFFTDVEMRETGHQGARVEVVDPFFEQANGDHLPVHVDQPVDSDRGIGRPAGCGASSEDS